MSSSRVTRESTGLHFSGSRITGKVGSGTTPHSPKSSCTEIVQRVACITFPRPITLPHRALTFFFIAPNIFGCSKNRDIDFGKFIPAESACSNSRDPFFILEVEARESQ